MKKAWLQRHTTGEDGDNNTVVSSIVPTSNILCTVSTTTDASSKATIKTDSDNNSGKDMGATTTMVAAATATAAATSTMTTTTHSINISSTHPINNSANRRTGNFFFENSLYDSSLIESFKGMKKNKDLKFIWQH